MPSFSFMNPSMLYFLPLAALPVVIHLISKKRMRTVDFPSLKFIKAAYMKRMRYVRLNELLLLLARMAIIAFLIFGFSRLCAFVPEGGPARGLKYAIIVDDSYSLEYAWQGEKMIDRAKKAAAGIVAKTGNDPRFIVYAPSTGPVRGVFMDQNEAAAAISKISTACRPFSPSRALASLAAIEGYRDLAGLFIVSDLLAADRAEPAALDKFLAGSEAMRHGPRIELLSVAPAKTAELSANRNFSISSASCGEDRVIAGRPFTVRGKVRNHSAAAGTAEISLLSEDSAVASAFVSIAGGAEAEFSITHSISFSGAHPLKLRLAADAVAADNEYHLVVSPISAVSALVLFRDGMGGNDQGHRYLLAALNPLNAISMKDGLVILPVGMNLAFQSPGELGDYDVVFISGVDSIDEATAGKLKKYLAAGGGVMILPPAGGDLRRFDSSFAGIAPARFPESSATVSAPNENSFFNLTDVVYDHPAFAIFKGKASGDIESPKFFRIITSDRGGAAPEPGASVLARFERSVPALVEKRFGRGISMMFTGFLDSVGSTLPRSPLFVPFVHQLVHHLNRNRSAAARPTVIGEPITETFQPSDGVGSVTCHPPGEGRERRLTISSSPGGLYATFTETHAPGLYTFFRKSGEKITMERHPVNFDPRESSIDASCADEYSAAFSRYGLLRGRAEAAAAPGAERRIELASPLFIAVIALMAIEGMLMYRMRE